MKPLCTLLLALLLLSGTALAESDRSPSLHRPAGQPRSFAHRCGALRRGAVDTAPPAGPSRPHRRAVPHRTLPRFRHRSFRADRRRTRPRCSTRRSPRFAPFSSSAQDLVRVRLELARAFFLKREDDLARESFERVLAGEPPPTMAANIRRFLREIWARRRWSARFGLALAPDSNLNAASDDDVIYIVRAALSPRCRRGGQVGVRGHRLGRGRVPASAGRAGAASRGRGLRAARVCAQGLRPDLVVSARGATLACKSEHRAQSARQWRGGAWWPRSRIAASSGCASRPGTVLPRESLEGGARRGTNASTRGARCSTGRTGRCRSERRG